MDAVANQRLFYTLNRSFCSTAKGDVIVVDHSGTEGDTLFRCPSPNQYSAAGDKVPHQQFLRQPLSRGKLVPPPHLGDAICHLLPVSINDEHIRANQLCSGGFHLLLQDFQLLWQPDVVLVAVSEVVALRLFCQPLEGLVGTQVFLVSPYLKRKGTDALSHQRLYLPKRHCGRTVIPNIEPEIGVSLPFQRQQLLTQPVHPRLVDCHEDGNSGLTAPHTSAHNTPDTPR